MIQIICPEGIVKILSKIRLMEKEWLFGLSEIF